MTASRKDLCQLISLRDELEMCVGRLAKIAARVTDDDCLCFFCLDINHAAANGCDMLANLGEAIGAERASVERSDENDRY